VYAALERTTTVYPPKGQPDEPTQSFGGSLEPFAVERPCRQT